MGMRYEKAYIDVLVCEHVWACGACVTGVTGVACAACGLPGLRRAWGGAWRVACCGLDGVAIYGTP